MVGPIQQSKVAMNIQRCYEIFDLERGASLQEVEQAYRDLVNVWHPDRIPDNPRLKKRAEEKLKELNLAYEILKDSVRPRPDPAQAQTQAPYIKPGPESGPTLETVVESGTKIVLSASSYIWKTLRRMVENQIPQTQAGQKTQQGKGRNRGNGRKQGGARGRGKGGGPGKGRGRKR